MRMICMHVSLNVWVYLCVCVCVGASACMYVTRQIISGFSCAQQSWLVLERKNLAGLKGTLCRHVPVFSFGSLGHLRNQKIPQQPKNG